MKEYKNIISAVITILILIILIQIEPLKDVSISEIFGLLIGFIIIFYIVKVLVIIFLDSNIGQKIEEDIKQSKELEKINEIVQNDIFTYKDSKKTFMYFSNERLISLYNEFEEKKVENMERLALEEIMVEKSLLSHSKMHEKLHKLKKHFDI